jgi:hypothetical protein
MIISPITDVRAAMGIGKLSFLTGETYVKGITLFALEIKR